MDFHKTCWDNEELAKEEPIKFWRDPNKWQSYKFNINYFLPMFTEQKGETTVRGQHPAHYSTTHTMVIRGVTIHYEASINLYFI